MGAIQTVPTGETAQILSRPDVFQYWEAQPDLIEDDVREFWRRLRRRKKTIGASITAGLCLGLLTLTLLTPTFKSEALVSIDLPLEAPRGAGGQQANVRQDDSLVADQVQVITSRDVVGQVVDSLNLTEHGSYAVTRNKLGSRMRSVFPFFPGEAATVSETRKRQIVIEKLQKQINVVGRSGSRILEISAVAEDPVLAATIANTLVETYDSTRRTYVVDRLRARAEDFSLRAAQFRQELITAERKLEDFRNSADLSSKGAPAFAARELQDLNQKLINARIGRIEANSRLAAFRDADGGVDAAALPEALDSRLVQRLREVEANINSRIIQLQTVFHDDAPQLDDAKAELNAVQTKIDIELKRITDALVGKARIASKIERDLIERYNTAAAKLSNKAIPSIQLAELEREATAQRALFETYLTRASEYNALLDASAPDFRIRIISSALPGIDPVSPKASLIIFLALFLSGIIGIVLALVVDYLDPRIWDSSDAEKTLGMPVFGELPELGSARTNKLQSTASLSSEVNTKFSRTLRDLTANFLSKNQGRDDGRVVMVTSPNGGDGKTFLSANLAQNISRAGKRVIVIDADFHDPNLHQAFQRERRVGLSELLNGEIRFSLAVTSHRQTGTTFLSGGMIPLGIPDGAILSRLHKMVAALRSMYDVIIIDTAAIETLPENCYLTKSVDDVFVCLRAGKITPETARKTVRVLRQSTAANFQTIITRTPCGFNGGHKNA